MSCALNRILRQYVVGIDVQNEEVRLVVLSHRWLSASAVRFEYAARHPLPIGIFDEGEWVSPADITQTLHSMLCVAKQTCEIELKRAVMALPASMIWLDEIDIQAPASAPPRNKQAAAWLNELEPLVLAQAEQALGIPPIDIAADWFAPDPKHHPHRLTIVAAPKTAIEVRMESTAQLDIQLTAIDGEASAALRACRFAAAYEVNTHTTYVVVWLGSRDVHAYLLNPNKQRVPTTGLTTDDAIKETPSIDLLTHLSTHTIARETCFMRQSLSGALLIDRLHAFIDPDTPKYIWFAGESEAFSTLEAHGFNTKAIGLALNCTSRRFDATRYKLQTEKEINFQPPKDPCFATAFGLALRGVLE